MNKWFWIVIVLLGCVVVGLLVYPSSKEKALKAYEEAVVVERAADSERAMTLYDKVIADYPDTEGAVLAAKRKLRILGTREQGLKKEMQDQVGRILLVLNGYQSMFSKLPASISDLDDGKYFFDSEYLAEVVPEGYTTYLALSDESPRIWPIRADKDSVYVSTDKAGSLQGMSKSDALQEIEAGYTEVVRKGGMVFLQSK